MLFVAFIIIQSYAVATDLGLHVLLSRHILHDHLRFLFGNARLHRFLVFLHSKGVLE